MFLKSFFLSLLNADTIPKCNQQGLAKQKGSTQKVLPLLLNLLLSRLGKAGP